MSHLEVAPVDPDGRLWDWMHAYKLEVKRPDAVMLGDGERSQRTVERLTTCADLTLVHQELTVVKPYAGHLIIIKILKIKSKIILLDLIICMCFCFNNYSLLLLSKFMYVHLFQQFFYATSVKILGAPEVYQKWL